LNSNKKLSKSAGKLVTGKVILIVVTLLVFCSCKSDQPQKFGAEITLSESTKISEILENPDEYLGKKVLVEGTVIDVCKKAGCWLEIASDVPNQKIKIKVKDGDIVFALEVKGGSALVEGIVYSIELDEEEVKEYFQHLAEETGKEFDSTAVAGPMTIYQIKGLGAEIEM
jgi:hypothetical protein